MRIYLINLESRKDRLEASKVHLNKLERDYTPVIAVDSKNISDADSLVTTGVKACWESHKKCFQLLVTSDENYAVIFEDDIEIQNAKEINLVIDKAIDLKVDLLQLGFLTPGLQAKLLNSYFLFESSIFRSIGSFASLTPFGKSLNSRLRVKTYSAAPQKFLPDLFFPGTHAYLISKEMAREILKLNTPQFLSADDFFTALARMRSFRMFRSRSSLVTQSNSSPSIVSRFKRAD
jgi:GR25 family glycosyltransferase involved in LPS biosynthesis